MITGESDIAFLEFDEEQSVLHITTKENANMENENTVEHYRIIHKLTAGKKYLALVNATKYFGIDPSTLKLTASKTILGNRVATAHYNAGLANRLTADFFQTIIKPPIPFRVFKTKSEAVNWLMTQTYLLS